MLGKKASQLRFKRISELIHRSATYPDLDYARVSVFFQDIVDDGSALTAAMWGGVGTGGSGVAKRLSLWGVDQDDRYSPFRVPSPIPTHIHPPPPLAHAAEDGYTVVPGSQLVVTRTAHRNDSSAYYVNDRKATMGEVTTLLKSRGIDLDHNRFLILQGEVESIAMMKPKAAAPGEEGACGAREGAQ